ncbi:MAG: transposase zinc-binding domain-containing protein [Myxococcales bacterium]|nr:transposase zinc-binding domain-containing protein [Myxococcales bacterium]
MSDERYRDLGPLGEGATGEVRRVHDRVLDRVVAVKRLRESARGRGTIAARFVEEARATAQLQHPSVVPVCDAGSEVGALVRAAPSRKRGPGGDVLPLRVAASVGRRPSTAVGPVGSRPAPVGTGHAWHRVVATLEIRGTHGDLLHRLVGRGLAELRREVEAADTSMPWFVWRELERYVGCGDPEGGFAWLVCDQDDHHRLVPHSCKTRAFCPACNGRRMAEQSARWCEEVLPLCPHRQWVLTAPFARRAVLAYRPELAQGVLALALDEVFGWLAARAQADLGVVGGRAGAVTVEHRCSSSLELNPHFHSLVPDGVFARGPDDRLHFHRVTPTRADLEHLVERIADRCEAWLEAHGVDDEPTPDDAQAQLLGAAAAGRAGAGPSRGQRDRRSRTVPARSDEDEGPGRGVSSRGWGLHAGTWVPERDRRGCTGWRATCCDRRSRRVGSTSDRTGRWCSGCGGPGAMGPRRSCSRLSS